MSDHHMKNQDEFSGMRLLTDFQTAHSAFGEFVLLKSSFVDTLSGIADFKAETYPDQQVMIRLKEAKALISELQKRVQYIEAGIEDAGTSSTFLD
jgi:hypothetical protein